MLDPHCKSEKMEKQWPLTCLVHGLQPIFLFFHSFVKETFENLRMCSYLHISIEVYNLHFVLSLSVCLGNLYTGKTEFFMAISMTFLV